LDWSLRLERAGVKGEGLSFSQKERQQAHNISINIQGNVENLSNIIDTAQEAAVTVNQSGSKTINVRAFAALADQLREHLNALAVGDQHGPLADQIDVIQSEAKAAVPDRGKLQRALTAIQRMIQDAAVGAGSSIIAKGALALINDALKLL
jgi:hypothetical protein